jgi:hypothetical protein
LQTMISEVGRQPPFGSSGIEGNGKRPISRVYP